VTVGDVVAATALGRDEVEATLRGLLESRRGHLEVGETGTLVYRFDPRLIQRDAEPLWTRIREGAWEIFARLFKIWIVLMLVVYFVLFVVLLVAALVASQSRGGGRGGGRRWGGRRGGFGGFPTFWFWYVFWTPDWRWGRPYYGRRWERRYGRSRDDKPRVPFLKKVFAFVFGPDRPRPTRRQRDRSILRLIRARKGVLTAAELVQHTGQELHEAEEEMARLMAAHDGDVRVSEEGVLTYVFPELMVSAEGRVREREPDPAWRRLEPAETVTGNDGKANAIIGGMNGFNLVAAATAPWFIFPELGLGGPVAWVGLVWVPLLFSASFFAIPLLRSLVVRARNRRRAGRNLRKLVLGRVLQASLVADGARPVRVDRVADQVRGLAAKLSGGENRAPVADPGRHAEAELLRLLAEWDGEVEEEPDGVAAYRFPALLAHFRGGERMRRRLALQEQEVGTIVYASDDTPEEAGRRELEAFDREMERERALEAYVQSPDRVDVLDDFELVAFDEEMERGQAISA
jgi:hypothetical protein